jgi:hypothetical protein
MRLTFASLMAVLFASASHANDTMAELKTGGLEFVQSGDVTMAEEHLSISPELIAVDYVFHNNSDHDISTVIAFPLPDITGSPDMNIAIPDWESDNFLDFKAIQEGAPIDVRLEQKAFALSLDVTADLEKAGVPLTPFGEKVSAALEKLDPETAKDWLSRGIVLQEEWDDGTGMKKRFTPYWKLRSAYWWKTTFPAKADVKVSHVYKTGMGGTVGMSFLDDKGMPGGERWEDYKVKYCVDEDLRRTLEKSIAAAPEDRKYSAYVENWISYVLTTGGNWAGSINKFRLTIDKGAPGNLVSFCGTNVKKTGPTTFEMNAEEFWPERDLDILLLKKPEGDL